MKQIDPAAVSGIASAALFRHLCPDGLAAESDSGVTDPDARWPEENATIAAGVGHGQALQDSTAFQYGFTFGLQLGARIGADPMRRHEIADLVTNVKAEISDAYKESDGEPSERVEQLEQQVGKLEQALRENASEVVLT